MEQIFHENMVVAQLVSRFLIWFLPEYSFYIPATGPHPDPAESSRSVAADSFFSLHYSCLSAVMLRYVLCRYYCSETHIGIKIQRNAEHADPLGDIDCEISNCTAAVAK